MIDTQRNARASLALAATAGLLVVAACQDGGPLGPAAPAPQGGRVVAAHVPEPVTVPYVGTLSTTSSVPASPPPGCQMFLDTRQEGHATILGDFTGVGTTCAFNGHVGVTDPPFSPAGGPPYFVTDFTVEQSHTAANGDVLEISGSGVFVQSLADGSSVFVGTGTVAGGTGRFLGATGAFDIESRDDGTNVFDGWMALDASRVSLP